MFKVIFLGQAGLLFTNERIKILIDPYLSDSVEKVNPKNKRRQRIDESFLQIKPDVIVITHNHADHYDKETLRHYLKKDAGITVLSPFSVWRDVKDFADGNNCVMFNNGTTWTEGGVVFRAVRAEHSDEYAIGVVIEADGESFYVTGDTLYSEKVFESLPDKQYKAVFLPINGVGNNMNAVDAMQFVSRIKTKYAVPVHFGMFDSLTGDCLKVKNRVIPVIYKEIEI